MSELVERLAQGEHPVEVSLRPERTIKAFKERLDSGYVHVKFTSTRGGTELGFAVDRQRSNFSAADFANEAGSLLLVGDLSLDFVKVRCIASIELPAMQGRGRFEVVPDAVETTA